MTKPIEILEQSNLCPLCSGTEFTDFKLGLCRCNSCDVVLSPVIWQAGANNTLEDEWFGEDYQPDTSFWVPLFEKWNNRKTFSRLSKTNLPGKRLLEVGVGSGSFLNTARDLGFEVVGCDLSEFICKRVQNVYGISIHCMTLATLHGENRFDIIVMNHVLEHVQNPTVFLQDVKRLLTQGGVVHIAVPNVCCWEATLRGWTSYEPYHLSYFSKYTIKQLISKNDLLIDHISTHDSFSGWFLTLLRTILGVNRKHGAVTRPKISFAGSSSGRQSRLVEFVYRFSMACSGAMLWPLRWTQGRLGRGDEVICIAHKTQS